MSNDIYSEIHDEFMNHDKEIVTLATASVVQRRINRSVK